MTTTVMINTRIDKTLKEHGIAVLDAHGLSTTDFIKQSFEYLETHQNIPEYIKQEEDKYTKRRNLLRAINTSECATSHLQSNYDPLDDKHIRAEEKDREWYA